MVLNRGPKTIKGASDPEELLWVLQRQYRILWEKPSILWDSSKVPSVSTIAANAFFEILRQCQKSCLWFHESEIRCFRSNPIYICIYIDIGYNYFNMFKMLRLNPFPYLLLITILAICSKAAMGWGLNKQQFKFLFSENIFLIWMIRTNLRHLHQNWKEASDKLTFFAFFCAFDLISCFKTNLTHTWYRENGRRRPSSRRSFS